MTKMKKRTQLFVCLVLFVGGILTAVLPYVLSSEYKIARQMKILDCQVNNNTLISQDDQREYFINVTLSNGIIQTSYIKIYEVNWDWYLNKYNKTETTCNFNPKSPYTFYLFSVAMVSVSAMAGFTFGSIITAVSISTAVVIYLTKGDRDKYDEIFG